MQLLALDTATAHCGVGLALDGRILAEIGLSHGQTHARHLMAGVRAVLELAEVRLQDVDAFAVTRGPGSFTGLRIGISTAKGMALATGKPIVGVSGLDVLAHQAGVTEGLICPMLDARRNEVYWSLYRKSGTGIESIGPEQVGPAAQAAAKINGPCMFLGSGAQAYREIIEPGLRHPSRWESEMNSVLRAAWVARLAWKRLEQGESDDLHSFAPVYLRKSDAELNSVTGCR
jgi:tRNA threonylcarbamoyladenosine biosynthesis protein TsaB